MAAGDKIFIADKPTLDLIASKIDSIKLKRKRTKSFSNPGSYSWVVPSGVTEVFLTGTGAGGGGGTYVGAGGTGGATSFGAYVTLVGGAGGGSGTTRNQGGTGGIGAGLNGIRPGGNGGDVNSDLTNNNLVNGAGGGGGFATGGIGGIGSASNKSASGVPGGIGGAGGGGTDAMHASTKGGTGAGGAGAFGGMGPGGGAGAYLHNQEVTVVPNQSISITIGAGGSTSNSVGGKGGDGLLIIEWYE